MCQKCYDRGYDDFPSFVGSVAHPEYYQKGFNDRQSECDQDAEELQPTDFCQKCYDRGVNDGEHDVWGPPTQQIRGHYSSYSKGYKTIEQKERNRQNEIQDINHPQSKNDWYGKNEPSQNNRNKYQPPVDKSPEAAVIKLIVGIALVLGILWLILKIIWIVFAILIPLIIINTATVALIASFTIKKWRKGLYVLSFLGAIYIFLDYKFGGLTKILPKNVDSFADTIPFFFYLNFSTGLVAGYFIFRDLLNKHKPPVESKSEFSKRNLIIMGCLLLVGGSAIFLQNYYNPSPSYAAENTAVKNTIGVIAPAPPPQQVVQQSNYQQPTQPAPQPVEAYIPIPNDPSTYPKEADILHDADNSHISDFSKPDDCKYFKIIRSVITGDSKNVLELTVDVLRHTYGNEYHQYEMVCMYQYKNTDQWVLYNCHATTFPVTYMMPTEENVKADLKGKFANGWDFANLDNIKDVKITHLTYDRTWVDDAPVLYAQIQVKDENTNENTVSDIIVHYKQDGSNNKWDVTDIEPQSHSEAWNKTP